jgi:hypothetical protein
MACEASSAVAMAHVMDNARQAEAAARMDLTKGLSFSSLDCYGGIM